MVRDGERAKRVLPLVVSFEAELEIKNAYRHSLSQVSSHHVTVTPQANRALPNCIVLHLALRL